LYDNGSPALEDAIQYTQLSEWLNELLDSSEAEDEEGRQYWLDQREKLPQPLVLPCETGSGGKVRQALGWEIDANMMAQVQQLAQAEKSSVQAVLLAC